MRPTLSFLLACLVIVFLGSWILHWKTRADRHLVPYQKDLKLGWGRFYPYQFRNSDGGAGGLEAELLGAVLQSQGIRLDPIDLSPEQQREQLLSGQLDAVSLAFPDPTMADKVFYSKPYFKLQYAVFWRRDEAAPARHPQRLLQQLLSKPGRLAALRGFDYPPEIRRILTHPKLVGQVHYTDQEIDSFQRLAMGQVDLVFSDEIAGLAAVAQGSLEFSLDSKPLDIPGHEVHVAFSKKTVSIRQVEEFNRSLSGLEHEGAAAEIVREYLYVPMFGLLTRSDLFQLMGLLGSVLAGVSGLVLAHREGYNLMGAFLIAASPAVGGGLIRDLVADRRPVALMRDPTVVVALAILTLVAALAFRLASRHPISKIWVEESNVGENLLLNFFDTLGVAAFTVMGVVAALEKGCEPLWLWGPLLAASTAGGGGVLRDLIRGDRDMPMLRKSFYMEVALIWGCALSVFLSWYSTFHPHRMAHLNLSLVLTVVGVCVTRYAAHRWRWRGVMI
ncbi:TRIC cation channel family protein [bacterium]|nr:TRIC cation channel family protein [bacterium]